jgi:hypothetical protein
MQLVDDEIQIFIQKNNEFGDVWVKSSASFSLENVKGFSFGG